MKLNDVKAYFRRRVPRLWNLGVYGWWRVRLLSRRTETSTFRQMRNIAAGNRTSGASVASAGKNILFFASRQERDQVAVVSILGWALKRRGHRVAVIGCDRVLKNSCNTGSYPKLDPWLCRTCCLYARHSHSLAGLDTDWLSTFVSPKMRRRAAALVDALDPAQYSEFEYKGLELGRMVRHSVAHFLRTDKLLNEPIDLRAYREWLISGIWMVEASEAILSRFRPDTVVLLNGLFAPEWIMRETAKRHSVRVIAWEVGFRPETFVFQIDRETDVVNNAHWERFRDVPLTDDENRRLDAYFQERETGGGYLVNYFPKMKAAVDEICREFKIDRSRKVAVLFPSITWDSTLFEKDIGFDGMADWIGESIRFFAGRPDAQLIIRVHPAEKVWKSAERDSVVEVIRDRFPQLPQNVIVIPPDHPASSYALMRMADCGLVYGSTTGMEMGVRGIPVILSNQVYYGAHGFTYDATSRENYRELLGAALDGRLAQETAERKEAWRRYAYFAIFRSTIPIREIQYQLMGAPIRFTITDAGALESGKDPNLDVICEGIVNGSPFLAANV